MLLLRARDQFVAGLSWAGYALTVGPQSRAQLVASGPGPRELTLTLPPQSTGETKFAQDAADITALRAARVSGASRLVFTIADVDAIDVSVDAVLQALTARGLLRVTGDAPTTIEMPWHLPFTPRPDTADGALRVDLHVAAPMSDAGVTGLWTAQIDAGDSATLRLQPHRPDLDDAGLDVAPLSAAEREMVFDAASGDPHTWARIDRLELSALGGWLDASLATDGLSWQQTTAMGRDASVQVSLRGVLYPFGHRAVYVESAERRLGPDGPHAVAGLQRTQRLVVVEPLRRLDDAPLALQRQFPFASVELLSTSFPGLAPASFEGVPRPVLPDDDLREALQAAADTEASIRQSFQEAFDEAPHSVAAYGQLLIADETALGLALQEARIKAHRDPDAMQRMRDKAIVDRRHASDLLDRALAEDPRDQDQVDALDARIAELDAQLGGDLSQAAIDRARAERPIWLQRLPQIEQQVADAYAAEDTLDEFIVTNFPDQGAQLRQAQADTATLNQRLAQVQAAVGTVPPSFYVPTAADGTPYPFTVRCAGAMGDVVLTLPLVFLRDEVLPAGDHLDALAFTRDPATLRAVQARWKGVTGADSGTVAVPGAAIDLVRDPARPNRPGDVHEVHALTLHGEPTAGGFWPKLLAMEVELPTLRSLLPDVDPRQLLAYSPAFATAAAIPEMPLRFVGAQGADFVARQVGVDFSKVADRAGGLVSPNFFADGISREFGVAAAAAVPRAVGDVVSDLASFDPRTAFANATLLGLPLSSLIALATGAQPAPPAIVQLFEQGLPAGVEMRWQLALAAHGPFRPLTSATHLDVLVRRTPTQIETVCTVDGFLFVLPGGDSDVSQLITLEFSALTFTLRTGAPPKLDVSGFKVSFGGAMKLLAELQDALQSFLGVRAPRIDSRPDGVSATYALDIPRLPTAGVFVIEGLGITTTVDVPFDARPVTFSLSFASRDRPFHVTVLAFGGGGYLDLTIGPDGLRRLEAAIEFGAAIAVDFFIARGEVHAYGGIRFIENRGAIDIDGYLDIGGSVEVLGLVSVSIALLILLHYESADAAGNPRNRLVGRARLVIEIDLTLYSKTVTIDSGEWVLAGSEPPAAPALAHARSLASPIPGADAASALRDRWFDYLNAFATP